MMEVILLLLILLLLVVVVVAVRDQLAYPICTEEMAVLEAEAEVETLLMELVELE
jgi:hypothetical protein